MVQSRKLHLKNSEVSYFALNRRNDKNASVLVY